ncbi:hypothetical protein EV651_1201 [Kribbella sp. VKM Ac-2571]|uniref:hypothetical protein n=1 Tax=Kribbella sp. VKM Ac-2571 TaxID=2512222 RepID=UPI00105F0382|nr:hypothetical protein [Kribbella sp. VKM Ac-2571]TDO50317.1 hypothetical protein EV651_1201 [Kribbella sp. VKM Ac-2571]
MTDNVAMERLLERLLAANWDDDEAEERHAKSRARLANEFLRRMAVWGDALGVERGWPFLKLALTFDPSIEVEPLWLERLEAAVGHGLGVATKEVVTDMFRWVALDDRPEQRFPTLDDPYEPMVQLLERGGEFVTDKGTIELTYTAVFLRTRAERSVQPPFAIDPASLTAVDEAERARVADSRAKTPVKHAGAKAEHDVEER